MRRLAPRPAAALALAVAATACGTPASSARPEAVAARPAAAAPAPATPAPPPPGADVLLARARALRAEGDARGAREGLEAAHLADPESAEVRIELADLLVSEGREAQRAAELLAGVRVPTGARFHLVSARLAELRGDDATAEDEYDRTLRWQDDTDVRLRRALVLDRLGRLTEATAELERVRTARPADALVRARLAERYEAAGRLLEAECELRAAAEAQPERPAGWERLAAFYERAGRPADARAASARAKELGGRNARALRPLLPSRN